MTDPEVPARDPSTAFDFAPSAATATADPHAAAPRRRRRWPMITLAAVVVAGLAAGLVVWAPWIPAVLRPAGLAAGPGTANSISFRWSRPPTGPLPDKYLILSNGRVAGSVAGTVTSYRQAGLTPASTYQYRVVAVRGGTRSPQSAALAVSTLTPPVSHARLQGSWSVYLRYLHGVQGNGSGSVIWELIPACTVGACDVMLHAKDGRYSFTMKLARAGARYKGQTVVNFRRCGPSANSIPDPTTLKVQVRVTDAAGEGQVWAATSWAGTMTGTYHFVSSAAGYCPTYTYAASLAGTPS